MFRPAEQKKGTTASNNDENALPNQGKKPLNHLLGPRRNVLGDVSNATGLINGNKTTLLPKRNLRSTTIQASMAVRAKSLGSTSDINAASGISSVRGRPSMAKSFDSDRASTEVPDKENIAPFRIAPTHFDKNDFEAESKAQNWDDLDKEDLGNPMMVAEYAPEIFEYMMSLEKTITPENNFMDLQKELNWHMRSVLVDWLIEVQWKSKLLTETLYLSINIIDRFLSKRAVSLVKLQLVGLAATLIASKYEEILSPSIANFIYFSDNAYTDEELLKAERYMLHVLNFNLAYPNPLVYLRRISKADDYDVKHRTLAKYLMELTLLDHRFICCPPSLIAAIAFWLARFMLRAGKWTPNLVHYSGGYEEKDLRPWAELLIDFLKHEAHKYEVVIQKYSSKSLMKASLFVQEYMRKYYGIIPKPLSTAESKETTQSKEASPPK